MSRVHKVQCKRGHKFTPENTIESLGHRECRTCHNAFYRENKQYTRKYYLEHKSLVHSRMHKCRTTVKLRVLTHYGPDGRLGCCWPECNITDIDMLSLDHVNNDGAAHRKQCGKSGYSTYTDVERRGYPSGFQTLCFNHQWKKEILRRSATRK